MYSIPDLCEIKKVLNSVGGFRHFNDSPYRLRGKDISDFRNMSFLSKYLFLYKNKAYSFFLNDLSLIGFENSSTGFFYYQTPYKNWKDFLDEYDLSNEDVLRDSDFMVDELSERENHFSVRYDYSEEQYNPGIHPVAHIHIGYETEIRIGCQKKLKPTSFVLFIIRQFYPELWMSLLSASRFDNVMKSVRNSLDDIDPDFYKDLDQNEMYLR